MGDLRTVVHARREWVLNSFWSWGKISLSDTGRGLLLLSGDVEHRFWLTFETVDDFERAMERKGADVGIFHKTQISNYFDQSGSLFKNVIVDPEF